MNEGAVRSEQKGKFFNGEPAFTVLPIAGRGYLQGSEKGLIKKRAAQHIKPRYSELRSRDWQR